MVDLYSAQDVLERAHIVTFAQLMICSETTTKHTNATRLEKRYDIFTAYILQLRCIFLIYFPEMAVEPTDCVQ